MKEPPTLIYVIGTYPSLTTTFIDREIKFLRRSGVDIQIVAMRRPASSSEAVLTKEQKELGRGTIYLLPVKRPDLILSHLYFVARHPLCYLKTLIYLVMRPHPNLQTRWMTLLHFGEGVYAAFLVRQRQFQELHAHFVDRAATIALVMGRLLGKPYSLSVHAGPDLFVNPVLLREKVMEARHVATCTAYNKAHLENLVGPELGQKVSYIHHGLDLQAYQPTKPFPDRRSLILSVGQLNERKGFIHLIKACRLVRDRGYDFICEIVGQGPQRQELEALIAQLSLQDVVTLCGALPHDQVIEKYRQATMFVLPCVKTSDGNLDGIPNVLPEAMAMRVPVISGNISGIPELVQNQVNGILISPGDDDALVDAMCQLLDDPALRERLAQNGRQTVVETFDVERNVRHFATTLWPQWFDGHNPGGQH